MLNRSCRFCLLLAMAAVLGFFAVGCDQFMSSALIYLGQNPPEYDKAIVQLKEGLTVVPENGNYYRLLAYCYFNNRQYPEARDAYASAIKYLPEKKDSLIKARDENWEDLYRGAAGYANRIAKSPPDSLQYFVDKAQKALDNAVTFLADKDRNYMLQAFIYQKTGKADEAKKMYLKMVEVNPKNAEAYVILGKTAYNAEKYAEAAEYFKKALEINPADTNSYFILGLCYFTELKYSQAIEPFRKAAALDPANRDALINWAKCLINEDKTPQLAIAPLEQALQLKEDDETWFLLGLVAMKKTVNDLDRAQGAFRRAAELKPAMRDYWIYLRDVYKAKNMKAEVKETEKRIRELK
jgi:tetratricopeptide (TPR) repeat protein